MKPSIFILPALVGALASPASSQGIGTTIPAIELEGLSQTGAKSFDEFTGRTVLLEFFAYW